MKKDIWILVVTAAILANIYYDNKLFKRILAWKKYYRMAGVALFGILLFLFCRKNPKGSRMLLENANDLIKFMPIDRNTTSLLQPILRYNRPSPTPSYAYNDAAAYSPPTTVYEAPTQPIKHKRAVSETKKKFIASSQGWRCKDCNTMLTAWFEVDHVTRLEHGGSNDVSNLVALCRNCHGKKTAYENM
jgi:RNase P subunit RPR2